MPACRATRLPADSLSRAMPIQPNFTVPGRSPQNRYVFIILGPLLAAFCYWLLPPAYTNLDGETAALSSATRATIAMIVWMGTWWLSEAVDLAVTSLLPLAMFPILGVADLTAATQPYASHFIFLFVGGFMIALAMQRWRLDRRIALRILLLVGTRPANTIAGFMIVTAALSTLITNTATTAMMLPIALSILSLRAGDHDSPQSVRFAVCLMLGIAYSASLGGMTTIIGTVPNAFAAGFLEEASGGSFTMGFADWIKMAAPITILILLLAWVLLTQVLFRFNRLEGQDLSRAQLVQAYRELGNMRREEWMVLVVFAATALLWMTRQSLNAFSFSFAGHDYQPFSGMHDSTIAMLAALALFILPGRDKPLMDWPTALRLPWGILLLLGGSFSLATAISSNGVDMLLASQVGPYLDWPHWAVVLLFIAIVVFLTEFTSNTATTASLVPLFAAFSPLLEVHTALIVLPVALAASCAFMTPIATPPNAIVFSSGYLHIKDMARAGLWMNLMAIAVLLLMALLWLPEVLLV